jgi:hypothetical protein
MNDKPRGFGRFVLFVAMVASAIAAFGALVLPRAASTEPPQALGDDTSVVLASARASDDDSSCPWKRDRGTETTVLVQGA